VQYKSSANCPGPAVQVLLVLCSEGLFTFFAPRLQYLEVKQAGLES